MPLGGVIGLFIGIAIFGLILLWLANTLGKGNNKTGDRTKYEAYECGVPVQEKRDTKISVKFYLTAILFIVFDIEIIFMYPWATTFRDSIASGQGLYFLVSMFVFLAVFIYGLLWEVKSKALEWD